MLDIDPKKAALRMSNDDPDRMESIGNEFFLKLREGYYEISHRN